MLQYRTGKDATLGVYEAFMSKLGSVIVNIPVGPSGPNANSPEDILRKNHAALGYPRPKHIQLLVGFTTLFYVNA